MLPTDKMLEHRVRGRIHLQSPVRNGAQQAPSDLIYYLARADQTLKANNDLESWHQTVKDKKQTSQKTNTIETVAVERSPQSENLQSCLTFIGKALKKKIHMQIGGLQCSWFYCKLQKCISHRNRKWLLNQAERVRTSISYNQP